MAGKIALPLTSSAKDALVFANTPSFFMNRLQNDPMVQYAMLSFSDAALYRSLAFQLQRGPRKPEDLIPVYVCLMALAIKAPQNIWAKVHALPLERLHWGRELVGLADAKRSEGFVSLDVHTSSSRPRFMTTSNSSWDKVTEITPRGVTK